MRGDTGEVKAVLLPLFSVSVLGFFLLHRGAGTSQLDSQAPIKVSSVGVLRAGTSWSIILLTSLTCFKLKSLTT